MSLTNEGYITIGAGQEIIYTKDALDWISKDPRALSLITAVLKVTSSPVKVEVFKYYDDGRELHIIVKSSDLEEWKRAAEEASKLNVENTGVIYEP